MSRNHEHTTQVLWVEIEVDNPSMDSKMAHVRLPIRHLQ